MKVSEIFCSIEGEGKRAGLPCIFIRLFGCNLRCSYCDSMYAVDDTNDKCLTEMSIDEILGRVSCLNKTGSIKAVTLTGGEPLLCMTQAHNLLHALNAKGYEVNIETNGSILCTLRGPHFYTMDVKCPSSGMETHNDMNNFQYLNEDDVVKFVVGSEQDLNYMKNIINTYPTKAQIFVSPVFNTIPMSSIVEYMIHSPELSKVRFQLQVHKFVWDPLKRGV